MRPLISWSALTSAVGRHLGAGRRGDGQPAPPAVDGHRARAGGRPSDRPADRGCPATRRRYRGAGHRCGRARRPARLRRGDQEPRHQPLPPRGRSSSSRPASPVRSGLGLWLEDVPLEHVVCITGTKGKSTTSAIAGHLLTRLGYRRHGGRQHRATPVGALRGAGARLLGHRDVELPGPRSDQRPPGRRRDLALPRPSRLARLRRALLRRQAVAVHQARGPVGDRRREQRRPCGSTPPRWDRTWSGSTPTIASSRAPGSTRSDCPACTTSATRPSPGPCCWPWASPRPATRPGWPRRPKGSPDSPAAAGPSATSARWSSSTTACRPTCSRPRPRSRPTGTVRSPSWSAGTTAASTTRPSAGPSRDRAAADPGGHHARQRAAHRQRHPRRGRRRGRGGGRRRAGRSRRRAPAPGPTRAASCCSRRPRPASGGSPTIGTAPAPSPRPSANCGTLT